MRWRQANILASGFRVRQQPDASSFPPSPTATEHRHLACAASGHVVRDLQQVTNLFAAQTKVCVPPPSIGPGKLYPVTAAQLLPNLTGIPRTAPRPQLTKNCRKK